MATEWAGAGAILVMVAYGSLILTSLPFARKWADRRHLHGRRRRQGIASPVNIGTLCSVQPLSVPALAEPVTVMDEGARGALSQGVVLTIIPTLAGWLRGLPGVDPR